MSGPETPSPVGWFRRPSFFGHPVPAFEHAIVADVMRAGLITCQPQTRLRGVAQAMAANHVHTVVVVDPGAEDPPGSWRVIHDTDLLRRAAEGPDGRAIDVATSPVTIGMDEPVTRAAQLMSEQRTRHLLAIDEDGHPIGVVSSLDLAAALAWGVGEPPPSAD
jgi:CBS domain-containing protein